MPQYNEYNVSIDGKSPLFNYRPYRAAGPAGAFKAWTLPNSNLVSFDGCRAVAMVVEVPFPQNTSFTTDAEAATVQLQWIGTAVTLHGTTNASSGFEVIRSWSNEVLTGNSTDGEAGVLFQEDDLAYGSYTLALTVSKGPVTVSGAEIITGMGLLG